MKRLFLATIMSATLFASSTLESDINKLIENHVSLVNFKVDLKKKDLIHYFSTLPSSHYDQTLAFFNKKFVYILPCLSTFFYQIKYVSKDDLSSFFLYADAIITKEIGSNVFESMIPLFYKIPRVMLQSFIDYTNQIMDERAENSEKIKMMTSFLKVPLPYIQIILQAINQHLKPFKYSSDVFSYFDTLKTISINDVDSVCEAYKSITYETKNDLHCVKLMHSIKEIPLEHRVFAVTEVASTFPSHMTHEDFCFLLTYFYEKIYFHPQKQIMIKAMKLFLGGELQESFSILGALLIIPDNEKEARFNRVLKKLELKMIHHSTVDILVNLQLPLDQDNLTMLNVYTNMNTPFAYAFGIVAESGWRSLRTCNAINKLFEYKSYSEAELDAGYKKFLMYLEMQPKDKKEKIKKVLGIIPIEKQAFLPFMEDWGRIFNYGVPPQHFIAYLFLFCENYPKMKIELIADQAKEVKNLREGLFSGLQGCIEDDGTLICEIGKLQKILTPVLQGRLDGAMIDDIDYDLEHDAIQGEEKKFIDEAYLKAKKTCIIRPSVIYEKLKLEFIKTRITLEQLMTYTKLIDSKIQLMLSFPVFKEIITARSVLEKRKKRFLLDHPEIDSDIILKETFITTIEQIYEINGGMWGGDKN